MLLLIFAHVNAGHHVFIIKQILRQRLRQLGFADAGSAEEYERAYRAAGIIQSGP